MNWIVGSSGVRRLHRRQHPKVEMSAGDLLVGSQVGVVSQREMVTLDSETEMVIKDIDIKTAAGILLLMAATEMGYHHLRQWKNAGLLGDEMIVQIPDYHLDLLRR